MNLTKSFQTLFLCVSLVFISFLTVTIQNVSAQQDDTNNAVRRGYRTGYSDGYMSGYRDSIENAAKNYNKHDEYTRADRAYNQDYGTLEDYRDGYKQGFESGYDTGFEKRSFDATVPANLSRRAAATTTNTTVAATKVTVETLPPTQTTVEEKPIENAPVQKTTAAVSSPVETTAVTTQVEQPVTEPTMSGGPVTTNNSQITQQQTSIITTKPENASYTPNSTQPLVIPVETELIVELLNDIDTDRSREGDKFQARVVSPNELGGAIIEGRIGKIQKPGRIKRRAEMALSFDRIILPENRWSNFNAILTEVLPIKGDNVNRIDTEGVIEGKSSVKDDSIKVGATTGTGLVIGAVTGGPVGAAVGASVGAAFGVGGVVIERGKNIRLNKNQQLRIKTAYETQIR